MRVVYDLLSSRNRDEDDDDTPAIFSLPETTKVTSLATRTSTRIRFTKNREAGSSWTVASAKSISRESKSVKRRADNILSWLSVNGCASEVKIRTAIGDTPDTSKALRLLVKKDEVKRVGAGGRSDPFLYMVTCKGEMES